MKNAVKLDENKIKTFLRENALCHSNNIQNYDLNNIYRLLGDIADKQKMKIKLDAFGVDKFSKRKEMIDEFSVELSYVLL
jgi:hypothetical protein